MCGTKDIPSGQVDKPSILIFCSIFDKQAETDLDHDEASAQLIVQDVPNAPNLKWAECNAKDATVVWQRIGEDTAPILAFIIQYSTSFDPETWETATGMYLRCNSYFNQI